MAGSGNLLVPVGVLGFVYDMLEGLAGLLQVDLSFINSRLQHMQSLSLGQQFPAELCNSRTSKIVARQHCQLDTKPCNFAIHIAIVLLVTHKLQICQNPTATSVMLHNR